MKKSIIREWRTKFGGITTGSIYTNVRLFVSIKSKREIIFTFKNIPNKSTYPIYEIHINFGNFETYIVASQPLAGTITTSKIVSDHMRILSSKVIVSSPIDEVRATKEFVSAMLGIVEDHNSPVNRGLVTTLLM